MGYLISNLRVHFDFSLNSNHIKQVFEDILNMNYTENYKNDILPPIATVVISRSALANYFSGFREDRVLCNWRLKTRMANGSYPCWTRVVMYTYKSYRAALLQQLRALLCGHQGHQVLIRQCVLSTLSCSSFINWSFCHINDATTLALNPKCFIPKIEKKTWNRECLTFNLLTSYLN